MFEAADIAPQVTWGTNPGQVAPVTGQVPNPADFADATDQKTAAQCARIHGPDGGEADHRPASSTACSSAPAPTPASKTCGPRPPWCRGYKVAEHVNAMVVPGSGQVKLQAEAEGLDRVFKEAGFDWREAGCSMCLAMNPDKLAPGERCASTSNRNFEGRQGKGGRTHLSPPPWPPPPRSPATSSISASGSIKQLSHRSTTEAN